MLNCAATLGTLCRVQCQRALGRRYLGNVASLHCAPGSGEKIARSHVTAGRTDAQPRRSSVVGAHRAAWLYDATVVLSSLPEARGRAVAVNLTGGSL